MILFRACYPSIQLSRIPESEFAQRALEASEEVATEFFHVYDISALTNERGKSGGGERNWVLLPEGGYFDFEVRGFHTAEDLKSNNLTSEKFRVYIGPVDSRKVKAIEKYPDFQSIGSKVVLHSRKELVQNLRRELIGSGAFYTRIINENDAANFISLSGIGTQSISAFWTPKGTDVQKVNDLVSKNYIGELITEEVIQLPEHAWDGCLAQVCGINIGDRRAILAVYSLADKQSVSSNWPGKYINKLARRLEVMLDVRDGTVIKRLLVSDSQ